MPCDLRIVWDVCSPPLASFKIESASSRLAPLGHSVAWCKVLAKSWLQTILAAFLNEFYVSSESKGSLRIPTTRAFRICNNLEGFKKIDFFEKFLQL